MSGWNTEFRMQKLAGAPGGVKGNGERRDRTFLSDPLTCGQNCPILGTAKPARQMDKRDRFITELRDDARAKGLSFRVDYRKGKGGHAMVYVGDRLTTLPSREIDPKTARKIRKQLGLAD
jgi:hypothetical protein